MYSLFLVGVTLSLTLLQMDSISFHLDIPIACSHSQEICTAVVERHREGGSETGW